MLPPSAFLVVFLIAGPPGKKVEFVRDLRPILAGKCFSCHGSDAEKRKGKPRLDLKPEVFKKERKRPVVVPGKPEESEMFRRVSAEDASERMPPEKSGKSLSKDEIALIREWIAQGAEWQEHWAFQAPVRPALPEVKRQGWVRNEIDRFILDRLEAEGLEPSPEAGRRTLIRRAAFDLTGLPPPLAEVEALVDDSSPDAYEKAVDRLLESPRYGEHMARFWLDAARYGDTHGLHLDNVRIIWPYRDYVINAFNRNIPFDRFTVEQLAGDLLPDATLEQKVATGFNRCHVSTSEGGVIAEEVYVRNVLDIVNTTGTVFLGMAVVCANCHDHKYDPLTMKDYYRMFAIFNNIDGDPLDGNAPVWQPAVQVPLAEQLETIQGARKEIAALEAEIGRQLASFKYEEPVEPKPEKPAAPKEIVWIEDEVPAGAAAEGGWTFVDSPVYSGKKASMRKATGLSQHFFTGAKEPLEISEGDQLFTYVYLDPQDPPKEILLQWNDGSWEHRAAWGEDRIEWGVKDTPSRRGMGPLPKAGEWARLEIDAARVALGPGAKVNGWAFTQFDGTVYWDRAGLVTSAGARRTFDSFAAWVDYQGTLKSSSLPQDMQAAVQRGLSGCSEEEKGKLRGHFIRYAFSGSRPLFDPLHEKIDALKKRIGEVEKEFPTTLVFKERAEPRQAFILKRGEYDKRGDQVGRGTPAFLPPLPAGAPLDRLGFARWLVDPAHPLTARVTVNRFWQQVFGAGLVKTAEDFGTQGEPPSHPQLLDWLAAEFIRTGWDVKRLMKLMVISAAYRQSAAVKPEQLAKDPTNRLLARGPRFRLEAEMVRDQALALSGLLVDKIGGPSVKPPQPAGLWEAVGYTGSNTANFMPDTGEKTYRRSLYTFWKRTAPPPQMAILDAPSREMCLARRERTNTPLQALLLMNEQQFVEAARHLAQRAMKEAGGSPEARAAFLFQAATARPPDAQDLADLLGAYRFHLAEYRKDGEAAKKLIQVGDSKPEGSLEAAELAAWTMVGNLILNLDETLTKG